VSDLIGLKAADPSGSFTCGIVFFKNDFDVTFLKWAGGHSFFIWALKIGDRGGGKIWLIVFEVYDGARQTGGFPMESANEEVSLRQRGRKRVAPLSIVPDVKQRRPEPPERLTPVEKEIWVEIARSVRPDWFRGGSQFLLELYVGMLARERQLRGGLQEAEVGSVRHGELLKLHIAVVRTASALAARLRLSVVSSHDRYAVRAVPMSPKPWQRGDDSPAA
jgi:hypothetical protein